MKTKKSSIAITLIGVLILLAAFIPSASAWTFSPEDPIKSFSLEKLSKLSLEKLVPHASFIIDPSNIYHGTYWGGDSNIFFMDTSHSDSPIVSWKWDFGDGYSSTLQNPTHMFPYDNGPLTCGPHEYTVTLTVTNKIGGHSTTKALITINNVN